jgi:hypothetical protein
LPPHGRIGLHPESACALDNVCDIEDKDGVLVLSNIKADAGQIMRIAVDYDIYCQDTAVRVSRSQPWISDQGPMKDCH